MYMTNHVAFIGFGEAAIAFVNGWDRAAIRKISAFDTATQWPESRNTKLKDYAAAGVEGCDNLEAAVADAGLVFSLVTADQAASVAQAVARHIKPGQYYLDGNSCSPNTKRRNAALIEAAGGHYLDVAIMAPVHPARHQTPLLVSGRDETAMRDIFAALDMNAEIVEGGVGGASTIKMIRSVMIKGLEALSAECLLAARQAGVDRTILQSLANSYPGFGWQEQSGYMLERMMVHGVRRAAEMREVAATIEELGINSAMTRGAVEWQQQIGELGLAAETDAFGALADSILKTIHHT
ncbi:DUF1932 domain-containing protein [Pontibacterium granulatum]|uniref:NAD(P)-dependent oxidoreductase n=1 Tax=Pontibacterium granulatum TaxID=2036029 RepID=UPI00249A539E|nr:DUF1932 domain-containing protein [Pontibacterium granulatum]MDI3326588.1 DUF1932 domain-containing protein [Pontibacterium granulatum]